MELLPKIDKKETKKQARAVLSQYRQLNRIASRMPIDIKSPIITDMPRGGGAQNKSQDAFLEWIDAEIERDAIVAALSKLKLVSRQILYYSFCDPEKRSNYEIGRLMSYSEKNIEKLKSVALLEFADAYRKGKCLAQKK